MPVKSSKEKEVNIHDYYKPFEHKEDDSMGFDNPDDGKPNICSQTQSNEEEEEELSQINADIEACQ